MNAPLLFAAANFVEVVRVLIVVVIFVVIMIGKLITALRTQQRPPGPARTPPPRFQQSRPAQQPQTQVPRSKSVKEEIDDFLRRAAQKKQEQTTGGESMRRAPQSMTAKRAEPLEAQLIRERPVGGEVSEHVKKFLDETQFDQRASKLGGDVAAADTKIEQHLKQVFGHGISRLADKPGETAAPTKPQLTDFFQDEIPAQSTAGAGLVAMLGNVDNLRQAIVLNEILQRPIDRW
jgi:hypothetical protein